MSAFTMVLYIVLYRLCSPFSRLFGAFMRLDTGFAAVFLQKEARMEQHCRDMLDAALLNFHSELGRYDWVPSTAMAGESLLTSYGVM